MNLAAKPSHTTSLSLISAPSQRACDSTPHSIQPSLLPIKRSHCQAKHLQPAPCPPPQQLLPADRSPLPTRDRSLLRPQTPRTPPSAHGRWGEETCVECPKSLCPNRTPTQGQQVVSQCQPSFGSQDFTTGDLMQIASPPVGARLKASHLNS